MRTILVYNALSGNGHDCGVRRDTTIRNKPASTAEIVFLVLFVLHDVGMISLNRF